MENELSQFLKISTGTPAERIQRQVLVDSLRSRPVSPQPSDIGLNNSLLRSAKSRFCEPSAPPSRDMEQHHITLAEAEPKITTRTSAISLSDLLCRERQEASPPPVKRPSISESGSTQSTITAASNWRMAEVAGTSSHYHTQPAAAALSHLERSAAAPESPEESTAHTRRTNAIADAREASQKLRAEGQEEAAQKLDEMVLKLEDAVKVHIQADRRKNSPVQQPELSKYLHHQPAQPVPVVPEEPVARPAPTLPEATPEPKLESCRRAVPQPELGQYLHPQPVTEHSASPDQASSYAANLMSDRSRTAIANIKARHSQQPQQPGSSSAEQTVASPVSGAAARQFSQEELEHKALELEQRAQKLFSASPVREQRAAQSPAAAAQASASVPEGAAASLGSLGVAELKRMITAAGLSYTDCSEKFELVSRAYEALHQGSQEETDSTAADSRADEGDSEQLKSLKAIRATSGLASDVHDQLEADERLLKFTVDGVLSQLCDGVVLAGRCSESNIKVAIKIKEITGADPRLLQVY